MNLKQFKSRKQKILFVVMMMLCVMFLAGCNTNTDINVECLDIPQGKSYFWGRCDAIKGDIVNISLHFFLKDV